MSVASALTAHEYDSLSFRRFLKAFERGFSERRRNRFLRYTANSLKIIFHYDLMCEAAACSAFSLSSIFLSKASAATFSLFI